MAHKVFVDTNILIYAHDRSAGAKRERARQAMANLWESGNGVLSTQVLQELCTNLRKKVTPPLPFKEIRTLIQDYLSWEIVVNDANSVIGALEFEQRHQISFWDALILQAAESSGAKVLYSEDFSNNRMYGEVRVLNPLI